MTNAAACAERALQRALELFAARNNCHGREELLVAFRSYEIFSAIASKERRETQAAALERPRLVLVVDNRKEG
jgi:hypothetical protein